MTVHEAWLLACRLFALGTPVLRATLSPRELALLPVLGRAIKPAMVDQSFVLCPHCLQHRAQVWGGGHSGRMCRCPDCGPVPVEANDGAAVALDEDWLRRQLRLALAIDSRDGIDDLGDDAWRLGDARRSPVILARNLVRLWREPALLERVRVAGAAIRVITPKPRETRGAPFGPGVEWLALEERFAFYGGGISFIGERGEQSPVQAADPTTPVHGPFSADFRWVTVPEVWPHGPIRLTEAQAAVFKALWSFRGEPMTGERIMQRAGLKSDKPIDVFKVKGRDKGKPEPERRLAAYGALVVTQQRQGLYAMPCAAASSLAPA